MSDPFKMVLKALISLRIHKDQSERRVREKPHKPNDWQPSLDVKLAMEADFGVMLWEAIRKTVFDETNVRLKRD